MWRNIDLRLDDDGSGSLKARSHKGGHRIAKRSTGAIVTFDTPGGSIRLSHLATSDTPGEARGNEVRYRGALGAGKDLIERTTVAGIEEEVVILDTSAVIDSYRVELALPGRLTARQAPGGVEIVDADGKVVFAAGGGIAFDGAITAAKTGAETPVTPFLLSQTNNSATIEFRLDPAWARSPARVMPITIDPSYAVSTYNYDACPDSYNDSTYLSCDTYVNSDNPYAGTYSFQTQLRAGSPGFTSASPDDAGAPNRTRAFVKFPTDGYGITGYAVESAQLTMHLYDGFAADGVTAVYGQWQSVTKSTAWQNQPGGSNAPVGRDIYGDRQPFIGQGVPGSVVYDVKALAQRWFNGDGNHGFRLEAPSEYDPGQFRKFYSGEGGYCGEAFCTQRSPRLVIEFEPVAFPSPQEMRGRSNPSQPEVTCMTAWGVNCATGNYVWDNTDLEVPGRGLPLRFTRTYNSQANRIDGPLGFGWAHSYDIRLRSVLHLSGQVDPRVLVFQENGSLVSFYPLFGEYRTESDTLATLTKDAGGWTFFRKQELTTFRFGLDGNLQWMRDLNGWTTTMSYSGGRLSAVTDPAGRSMTFAYWPSGKLRQVTDPAGRFVYFDYTGSLNTSVIDPQGGTTRYTYDTAGENHLVSVVDPRGSEVNNAYDGAAIQSTDGTHRMSVSYGANGENTIVDSRGNRTIARHSFNRLTSLTRGAGTAAEATWSFEHDATIMSPTRVVDPDGRVSTNTYDSVANLLTQADGLGRNTRYTYTARNLVSSATDPLGIVTTLGYTANGDLTSSERPLLGSGQVSRWTYGYDPARPGDLTTVVDPNNKTWRSAWDSVGNLASETDPLNNVTVHGYDSIGRRRTTTTPKGNLSGANPANFTTTFSYNNFSDLTKQVDPLGNVTDYGWDPARNLTSVIDPKRNTTGYEYDRYDQLTRTVRADASTTRTTYDTNGNIDTQIDGLGRVTDYNYDALDRVETVTDPLSRVTRYGYDRSGNLRTLTDAMGRVTTHTYDSANQRRATDYSDPATPDVSFDYDGNGRRERMVDGAGTNLYSYDSLNRLIAHTNGAAKTVRYGYDLKGQLTALTYPPVGGVAQPVVARTYDDAGRLNAVRDWFNNTTGFDYDANDNNVQIRYPNATLGQSSFDSADRLVGVEHRAGGAAFVDLDYTRDPADLLSTENATAYTYDALDRLRSASAGPAAAYSYDNGDNLTSKALNGVTTAFTFDAAHQLTQSTSGGILGLLGTTFNFVYDANGNRTSTTPLTLGLLPGTPIPYAYDQANRLTTAAGVTHGYDGDGLRVRKATTGFTWDVSGELPLVLTEGTTAYVTGVDGLPLERITDTGEVSYYHADQLGSTRAMSNAAGAVIAGYTYDPYGAVVTSSGPSAGTNPLRYAGEYTDSETGFIYLRARHYDPSTAQFLSRDPIESVTRQPYSYASNSPLNSVDPAGLADCKATGAAGVAQNRILFGQLVEADANNNTLSPDDEQIVMAAGHRKNRQPSKLPKHEKGIERRQRDQGGEKGDDKRRPRPKKSGEGPSNQIQPSIVAPVDPSRSGSNLQHSRVGPWSEGLNGSRVPARLGAWRL